MPYVHYQATFVCSWHLRLKTIWIALAAYQFAPHHHFRRLWQAGHPQSSSCQVHNNPQADFFRRFCQMAIVAGYKLLL